MRTYQASRLTISENQHGHRATEGLPSRISNPGRSLPSEPWFGSLGGSQSRKDKRGGGRTPTKFGYMHLSSSSGSQGPGGTLGGVGKNVKEAVVIRPARELPQGGCQVLTYQVFEDWHPPVRKPHSGGTPVPTKPRSLPRGRSESGRDDHHLQHPRPQPFQAPQSGGHSPPRLEARLERHKGVGGFVWSYRLRYGVVDTVEQVGASRRKRRRGQRGGWVPTPRSAVECGLATPTPVQMRHRTHRPPPTSPPPLRDSSFAESPSSHVDKSLPLDDLSLGRFLGRKRPF
jgi:hypothetical protein